MQLFKKNLLLIVVIVLSIVSSAGTVFAAGNIDGVRKYSQFLNIDLDSNGKNDFVNWNASNSGGVTVSDTNITGYIWGETVGWINLSPTNNPVTVTCEVTPGGPAYLGGFAWGQNTGWINFAPTMATGANRPQINTSSGQISGTVWSQNYGWLTLNSPDGTYPGLSTSWRGCNSITPPPVVNPPVINPVGPTNGSCALPRVLINGSCQLPPSAPAPVPGCTDSAATNYNANATTDDGSCHYRTTGQVAGCTDHNATNFNPSATRNDGSCIYPNAHVTTPVSGCTNPVATNYDPSATVDTGGCIFNPDPHNPPPPRPIQPPGGGPGPNSVSGDQSGPFGTVAGILQGVVNPLSPRAMSGLGWIAPVLGVIGLLSSIPGLITRLGNMLLTFFLARKKRRGVVYDAKSKEPLDPVYVSVIDVATGKEVANQITDMEGRFGFVLERGTYRIAAGKTHYQFPSVLLAGKNSDEVYSNLYFGDAFTVTDPDQVFDMSIPMDPVGTDWNQQEKKRMNILRYLIENQKAISWVFSILFVIGFVVSVITTYYYPVWWNILVVILYVIIGIIQLIGYGPVTTGKITKSGMPLRNAIVRIYNANLNREVAHKVTSTEGSYFVLVPKADYYITVEEKNTDGSYAKIFTSTVMRAGEGLINKSFDL